MTTPTQTGDKPMVTEADSDRAATWYPHRDAHMHKQLAAMLAAHREAAEKETLSREQSRNVGREALAARLLKNAEWRDDRHQCVTDPNLLKEAAEALARRPDSAMASIVVKLSAIRNVLREAHFALDDSEDLSHQDPPVHAVPFENVMRLDRALRACERFAPDNEAWDGPGPLATQIIERLGGLLTPPASPEQPSPLVLGLERAAQWHDARRKGPDVFEQELHEVSARALRHLAANPDLTDMEALEAGQPSPSPVTGEAVRDAIHDALVSAYRQGALDVHDEWVKLDLDDGLSDDPDFTEAAHDHAASEMPGLGAEIAALTTDQSQTERLRELVHESLYHLRLDDGAKAYHEKALAALSETRP